MDHGDYNWGYILTTIGIPSPIPYLEPGSYYSGVLSYAFHGVQSHNKYDIQGPGTYKLPIPKCLVLFEVNGHGKSSNASGKSLPEST